MKNSFYTCKNKTLKNTLLLIIVLFFSFSIKSNSQNLLLNGNFDDNICVGDYINLNSHQFDSLMANVTSFGTVPNPDIIESNAYCNYPYEDSWYVALTGGGTDAISFNLSSDIVGGNTYTLTWYDEACDFYPDQKVVIGVSTSPTAQGTIIYTEPTAVPNGDTAGYSDTGGFWRAEYVKFTAPCGNYPYLTVKTTGDIGNWTQVDDFILTFDYGIPITKQPSNSTICAETNTFFDIKDTVAGLSYQWQVNTGSGFTNISNGGVYYGATTDSLNLIGVPNSMNGYEYRCIAIDSCSLSDTSNSAELTITSSSPTIAVQPFDTTVCASSNATFSVTATGMGLSYQWQVNSGSGFSNVSNGGTYLGATTNTLFLTDIAASYNGYEYKCIITGCSVSDTSNTATLTVNALPTITIQPVNDTLCLSDAAYFYVYASGTGLTYTWQVNNGTGFTDISFGGRHNIYQNGGNLLSIDPVADSMNVYQYRCIISGMCSPADTSDAAILVTDIPHFIAEPVDAIVCDSSDTSFTITLDPDSGVTYQWQVNQGSGFTNISNGGVYSGATSTTLTLTTIPASMNGYQYRCILTGACAPNSDTAALTVVSGPPVITEQPVGDTLCVEDVAIYSVAVSGVDVTYIWQVNNGSGFTDVTYGGRGSFHYFTNGPDLYFVPVISMNGYEYRCIVTGACSFSDTSVIADLAVGTIPVITVTAESSSVCDGSTDTLYASGAGAGGNYFWSPAAGLNTVYGATVIASPTVTTIYKAIGATVYGCTCSDSITISYCPDSLGMAKMKIKQTAATTPESYLNVYPNPAKDELTITYQLTGNNGLFNLYDILGRSLKTIEINTPSGTTTISVADLPTGIYFYKFTSQGDSDKLGKVTVIK